MDAFEQVVSEILWMDGYWVRTSVKVDLTKEEKVVNRAAVLATLGAGHCRLQRPRQHAARG